MILSKEGVEGEFGDVVELVTGCLDEETIHDLEVLHLLVGLLNGSMGGEEAIMESLRP